MKAPMLTNLLCALSADEILGALLTRLYACRAASPATISPPLSSQTPSASSAQPRALRNVQPHHASPVKALPLAKMQLLLGHVSTQLGASELITPAVARIHAATDADAASTGTLSRSLGWLREQHATLQAAMLADKAVDGAQVSAAALAA
jgi:hypothetical protein